MNGTVKVGNEIFHIVFGIKYCSCRHDGVGVTDREHPGFELQMFIGASPKSFFSGDIRDLTPCTTEAEAVEAAMHWFMDTVGGIEYANSKMLFDCINDEIGGMG